MGCCSASPAAIPISEEELQQNIVVAEEIAEAKSEESRVKKLLLLGGGGSGKSTFFKQLTKIHGGGFRPHDRKAYRSQICEQLVDTMKTMICKCEDLVDEDEDANVDYAIDESLEISIDHVLATRMNSEMNEELAGHLKVLWEDSAIKKVYELRNVICVADSTAGFMDRIDELSSSSYLPSDEDLLLVRYRTAGMTEKTFEIEKKKFRVVDVGGQRNERRKWIHFFDTVTAVLFVAALSCYDEAVFEDEYANAMLESLEIFAEHINSHWFLKTAFVLFLNKKDLYDEKIKHTPITTAFPEYEGEQTNEACKTYIEKKFRQCNDSAEREIYVHVTQATDTNNVEKVFNDVQQIVVNFTMGQTGLI